MTRAALVGCLLLVSCVVAAEPAPKVNVVYVGATPLATLAAGGAGEGVLLYVLPGKPVNRPSLVVRLGRARDSTIADAAVFEAPPGSDYVPVSISDNAVHLAHAVKPAISLKAQGGWWARHGVVNYNLDIQVNTPSASMWGASYLPGKGFGGSASEVKPGEPFVSIRVRDPGNTGVPKWDLRQLIPRFPGKGYVRTNYVESECKTPLRHDLGVSPEWPFVAASGSYQQPVGTLRPPIVVDWKTGKVTDFSELVTARDQNCSYTVYSLRSLKVGSLNQADNEAPFAFYDLSGKGRGHPDLITRTEYFPTGDSFSLGQLDRPFQTVRYSWNDGVGNWKWDYKVEVMGQHSFTASTPIAGGLASITAPSFSVFPNWVMDRQWPVVTFVATEGHSYLSSEGIYDWSPLLVGKAYRQGRSTKLAAGAFSTIRQGFRGEYRVGDAKRVQLYFSPIDERLHLLDAQAGLLNLGGGWELRLANLTGGPYIDSWQLERSASAAVGSQSRIAAHGVGSAPSDGASNRRPQRLVRVGHYIVFATEGRLTVKHVDVPNALFVSQPPTSHGSWLTFRERLARFGAARRDPFGMEAWLTKFDGPVLTWDGVMLRRVDAIDGVTDRFVVHVSAGAHRSGTLTVPALTGLGPGDYVLTYDTATGLWERQLASAAVVAASLVHAPLTTYKPTSMSLRLSNSGTESWRGSIGLGVGGAVVENWPDVVVPGHGTRVETARWTPTVAGRLPATVTLGRKTQALADVVVRGTPRVSAEKSLEISGGGAAHPVLLAVVLAVVVISATLVVWTVWRQA